MSRFFAKSHGPHHSRHQTRAPDPAPPSSLLTICLAESVHSLLFHFPFPLSCNPWNWGWENLHGLDAKQGTEAKNTHTHPLAAPCGPRSPRHRLGCPEQRPQEGIISYSYRKFNKFPLFPPSPLPAPTARYGGILIAVESENKPHVKANSSSRSDDAAHHKCDARICTKITATRSFFYLN